MKTVMLICAASVVLAASASAQTARQKIHTWESLTGNTATPYSVRIATDGTNVLSVVASGTNMPAWRDAINAITPAQVRAYEIQLEEEAAQVDAPDAAWGRMTRHEKAQWYVSYMLAKRTGAPVSGWTFVQYLAWVKTNVFDDAPWVTEGLP